jgi:hypothetical protein
MRCRNLSILSAGLAIGIFVTVAPARKPRSIANGQWGGAHIRMQVADGSATIEYDCARGTITGPLRIDSRGRFSLIGKHVRERGVQARIEDDDYSSAARYTGWTNGKTMKMTVTLVGAKTEIGSFELTRGSAGRVFKCL